MWSMQTRLPLSHPIETKFLCMSTEREIGSLLDGWRVVWCQPDRHGIFWHIMVVRREMQFAVVAGDYSQANQDCRAQRAKGLS